MLDEMSFAEVNDQFVELLPARTVLSLSCAPAGGVIGTPGGPGTPGSSGPSVVSNTWGTLVGSNEQSTTTGSVLGLGDTTSKIS
jgi:hypothetical protein